MNKRIETVLNNREVKPADYFELVNIFTLSSLSLQKDKHSIVSMDINEFRKSHDDFEFRQKCAATHFRIKEKDIQAVSGRMLDDTEFLINVKLLDGFNIEIRIFSSDNNIKTEECKKYWEMELEHLVEYLNNEKHIPLSISVCDRFGFLMKSEKVDKLSLIEDEETGVHRVEILNNTDTEISFCVEEDEDKIYINYGKLMDTIIIRPYGQPFMKITIPFVLDNFQ